MANARAKIRAVPVAVAAERQWLEDERAPFVSALGIRYSARTDKIAVQMASGVEHIIPRNLIHELDDIPRRTLAKELRIGLGGDVITVRSHDVDISLPGLLRDLSGLNIQRLGGRARSDAKAAAARLNGRRGGRPPKATSGVQLANPRAGTKPG